jgi:hypothetical protein
VLALFICPAIASDVALPEKTSEEVAPEKKSFPRLLDPAHLSLMPEEKSAKKQDFIRSSCQAGRLELKWVSLPLNLVDQILARYEDATGPLNDRGLRLLVEALRTGKGTLDETVEMVVCDGNGFGLCAGTESFFVPSYQVHEKVAGDTLHCIVVPQVRPRFTGLSLAGLLWQEGQDLSLGLEIKETNPEEGVPYRSKVRKFSTRLTLKPGATYVTSGDGGSPTTKRLLLIRLVR